MNAPCVLCTNVCVSAGGCACGWREKIESQKWKRARTQLYTKGPFISRRFSRSASPNPARKGHSSLELQQVSSSEHTSSSSLRSTLCAPFTTTFDRLSLLGLDTSVCNGSQTICVHIIHSHAIQTVRIWDKLTLFRTWTACFFVLSKSYQVYKAFQHLLAWVWRCAAQLLNFVR